MHIHKSDIDWIASVRSDLNDFANQLDGTKTQCDCCSLMKWENYDQGMVKLAAQSAVTKVGKLRSLMEELMEAQSK